MGLHLANPAGPLDRAGGTLGHPASQTDVGTAGHPDRGQVAQGGVDQGAQGRTSTGGTTAANCVQSVTVEATATLTEHPGKKGRGRAPVGTR